MADREILKIAFTDEELIDFCQKEINTLIQKMAEYQSRKQRK